MSSIVVEAAWLAVPVRPFAALGEGQKSESAGGEARGRGGSGPIGWSAVHLQMAGSVYCVSPNLWPTWPRVNIQVASLVNQPHGTIRRSRTDGTIPRTPQSHEACVDAARESQASQICAPPPVRKHYNTTACSKSSGRNLGIEH